MQIPWFTVVLAKHLGKLLTPEVAKAIAIEIGRGEAMPHAAAPSHTDKQLPPWELWSPAGLLDLVCGNEWAARFLLDIAALSHTYDDLIDRDKPVTDGAIHQMVWRALVSIPENPFFNQHQAALRPVLATSILNWRAANDMEKSGCLEKLRISHATRYELSDVLLLCMLLTGGMEHAASNAQRARLMGQNDTWANYRAEHFPEGHPHADLHKI